MSPTPQHVVIGCDPGITGALAVVINGDLVEVEDMPTLSLAVNGRDRRMVSDDLLDGVLRGLLTSHVGPLDTVHFVLEEVGALPKEGPVGAFSFGTGWGIVRGVVTGLGLPKTLIRANVWKRDLRMRKGKDASRLRAIELFPHLRQSFARVKDDGRAEAALIAYWGYFHMVKGAVA